VVTGVALVDVVVVVVLSPLPLLPHATVSVLSAIMAAAPAATRMCRETRLSVVMVRTQFLCVGYRNELPLRSTRSAPIPSNGRAST
jgi:hypothetical protein